MLAMTKCDGRRKECERNFWYIFFQRFSGVLEELCEGCEMAAERSSGNQCTFPKHWRKTQVPNLWFDFAGEQRANRRHWCLPMLCHTWQWTSSSVIWRIEAGRYETRVYPSSQFIAFSNPSILFSDILPTLSYSFIDQTVQPGPLVSLKCSASGNPTPRISWTLDGYDLPQKDR